MLEAIERAQNELLAAATTPEDYLGGLRDLNEARAHVEDALTRYNSARYRTLGTWTRRDPDASA